ncbi:hypothetical protein NIES37_40260 [Tolypothrix tenuis PCC 7101]|uniref:Pepco domain-containing protein n=1 Tax=Tolypothrix tenuis PCC 7101 TaxID=231146 RepID=A0A1Z4N2R3_9CYAN|nr:hypothetical protein [Aulosira sp. FACHB-113]BAZ00043.1 hypothetical protein NIES37_40260 [Tolypothrix tenuis PCC 7101]BAZ76036.1 hypothetical protein NIES50_46330 [Aulosira laxa NIES-50]
MSAEDSTPKAIWIITEEVAETSNTTAETVTDSVTRSGGARSSSDTGGRLGRIQTTEEIVFSQKKGELVITRRKVEVTQLKQEMQGFLQAMREVLDEADQPNSKIQLDEVELSVEINAEGKISLFGIGGGKAGGKGAMTFKFKRK